MAPFVKGGTLPTKRADHACRPEEAESATLVDQLPSTAETRRGYPAPAVDTLPLSPVFIV